MNYSRACPPLAGIVQRFSGIVRRVGNLAFDRREFLRLGIAKKRLVFYALSNSMELDTIYPSLTHCTNCKGGFCFPAPWCGMIGVWTKQKRQEKLFQTFYILRLLLPQRTQCLGILLFIVHMTGTTIFSGYLHQVPSIRKISKRITK